LAFGLPGSGDDGRASVLLMQLVESGFRARADGSAPAGFRRKNL